MATRIKILCHAGYDKSIVQSMLESLGFKRVREVFVKNGVVVSIEYNTVVFTAEMPSALAEMLNAYAIVVRILREPRCTVFISTMLSGRENEAVKGKPFEFLANLLEELNNCILEDALAYPEHIRHATLRCNDVTVVVQPCTVNARHICIDVDSETLEDAVFTWYRVMKAVYKTAGGYR